MKERMERTLKFNLTILDYVLYESGIDVSFIPIQQSFLLNVNEVLTELKQNLFNELIFKKKKTLKYDDNKPDFNKKIDDYKFYHNKATDYNGVKAHEDIDKPNLSLNLYVDGKLQHTYEINLPTNRRFNYNQFKSFEFYKIMNMFENEMKNKIVANQTRYECDHFNLYLNLNATENLNKTLNRLYLLPLEERKSLIDKSNNLGLNNKDRSYFYEKTKSILKALKENEEQ